MRIISYKPMRQMIMDDNNLQMPRTPVEAADLYSELLYHIEDMI